VAPSTRRAEEEAGARFETSNCVVGVSHYCGMPLSTLSTGAKGRIIVNYGVAWHSNSSHPTRHLPITATTDVNIHI